MIGWIVLGVVIGVLIGAGVLFLVLRPRLHVTEELNQEVRQANSEMQTEREQLLLAISKLSTQRQEISESIVLLEEQANKAADTFYKKSMELANTNLDAEMTRLGLEVQEWQEQAKEEYLLTLKESVETFNTQLADKRTELQKLDLALNQLRQTVNAAVEADKRAAEMAEKTDFYRLVLSNEDIQEIAKLREAEQFLRDKEPLNKVIWKVYYEKPYTDLIGRVVGTGIHTGIYKITNINNGMCYVGQAANIADRWKQHIKRGIGAETPTRNKLYPAMLALGVENFTFEIVEECNRMSLDAREDYWQDYFHAKDFGYSIK